MVVSLKIYKNEFWNLLRLTVFGIICTCIGFGLIGGFGFEKPYLMLFIGGFITILMVVFWFFCILYEINKKWK